MRKVTQGYRDGHMRTFKGYPKMSEAILKLLKTYLKKKQYNKIMLFFISHCKYSEDYAGFLVREMMRGNL
jgi:hypothetical protein